MKENSDGNDTNVGSIGNSIEEALKKLSNGKKIKMYELLRTLKKEGIENFVITRKKYVDVILSDYKRVLKENEILKEEKEQAWEEWNNLEQGSYGTEQKLKQQIKESQKENKELKNKLSLKQFDVNIVYNDYLEKLDEYERNTIPVQKVKDKIEHYQKLQHNYIEKYDEINEGLQAMISALKELLGKE